MRQSWRPDPVSLCPELAVTQPIERDVIYRRRRLPGEVIEGCVRWPAGMLGLTLEVEVPSAGLGLFGRSNHSTTFRARRRALGTAEGSGHLDQRRRPGTLSSKPAAQRLPRDLCPFPMAQPDHIDQRALGRVEAEGQTVPDPDHLPAEAEGVFGEDMNVCGRLQRRDTSPARVGDVNAIRDDVRQAMAGEAGDQA